MASPPEREVKVENDVTEKAPLFGKWEYWYLFVIGFLILLIAFFYFFTKTFS